MKKVAFSIVGCVLIVSIFSAYVFSGVLGIGSVSKLFKINNSSSKITYQDIKKTVVDYSNYDFSSSVKGNTLDVSDCGAEPDELLDYGDLFRSAIKTAIDNNVEKINIPTGVYYVSPEDGASYVFDFGNARVNNLEICGNNAKIVLMDSYCGCFNFRNSKNIKCSDLSFDCIELPYLVGTVTNYDLENKKLTITSDSATSIFDDERFNSRLNTVFGTVRDKDNPNLLKKECNNFFNFTSCSLKRDNEYTVTLSGNSYYLTDRYIEVGDIITVNNRGYEDTFIFDVCDGNSLTLNNINIYNSPGGGVVARNNTGNIIINNFNMKPENGSDNLLCGNADGVHIQGCSGKVEIKNSTFANLSDDAINFYQWYINVNNVISNNSVEISDATRQPKVGESIEIVDRNTGEIVETTSIQSVNGNTIVFSDALKRLKTGTYSNYYMYINDNAFNNSIISDNVFENIRGRGMIIRANNITIERNNMKNISNHAFESWFNGDEGFSVNALRFAGNVIDNVSYINDEADSYDCGSISIHTNGLTGQSDYITNSNIDLLYNDIKNYHACAINLGNSKNVNIKGNNFNMCSSDKKYKRNCAIYSNISSDVLISDNTFSFFNDNTDGIVTYDANTVKNIVVFSNTYIDSEKEQVVPVNADFYIEKSNVIVNNKPGTKVVIAPNFTCGGFSGKLIYDVSKLKYVSCLIDEKIVGKNTAKDTVKNVSDGLKLLVVGQPNTGISEKMITLYFEGQTDEEFSFEEALFADNLARKVVPNISEIMLGDIDSNNLIDIRDLVRMKKYFAGIANANEKNADIDKNGKILSDDLVGLINILLSNVETFNFE